jgi:hypothetical protein
VHAGKLSEEELMLVKDLTKKRFGSLVVISRFGHDNTKKNTSWLCKCDCGKEKIINRPLLIAGTDNCGCLTSKRTIERFTTHGKTNSQCYKHWEYMKTRCLNEKCKAYKNYGGRGIKICDEWMGFENFHRDMGDPGSRMSLERIDNEKGYFKENCKWIPVKEQSKNRRTTRYVEYKGEIVSARELFNQLSPSCCCETFIKLMRKMKSLKEAL